MSLNFAPQTVTADVYQRIFDQARQLEYPELDVFEQRMGYALDRKRLEDAARVLCCPFKAAAPHWQHGRVIYAAGRDYFERMNPPEPVHLLDIGTAKGFSALCLEWAREDARILGHVYSVDVLNPRERVRRNTVAEVEQLRTLYEILEPWPETRLINFEHSTGIEWLKGHQARVHVAFVDGKHTAEVVRAEGKLLAQQQEPGDLVIFDDCQMPKVSQAVVSLNQWYAIEYLKAEPREYAIARRR